MTDQAEPTSFTCELHGEYPSTTHEGRSQQPSCPECETTGKNRKAQHRIAHRRWHMWQSCGVPFRYQLTEVECWLPQTKVQRRVAELVGAYLADLVANIDEGRGLTLLGPPGLGKTMLVCALVKRTLATSSPMRGAMYASWPEVLSTLRAAWAKKESQDAAELIERLKTTPLLALDELALRQMREGFESDLLLEILDARYNAAHATLVASNVTDLAALAASIGERAADRLRDSNTLLLLDGASMRGRQPPADEHEWPEPPTTLTVRTCWCGRMSTKNIEIDTYSHGRRAL